MRRTLGDAQDRGLVEQRVEHAPGAEALLQAVGDVVDPALARHVLAEQDQLRAPRQLIGQRRVQVAGQRPGVRDWWPPRAADRPPASRRSSSVRSGRAARSVTREGWYGAIGPTTASVVSSRGRRAASSAAAITRARVAVHQVAEGGRRDCAGLDQAAGVAQQRIRRLVVGDLCRGCGRRARRRCRHGPTGAPPAGAGRPAGASCARSAPPRRRRPTPRPARRRPACSAGAAGRPKVSRIQSSGVGTLMPVPLSSQTNRIGIGRPMRAA